MVGSGKRNGDKYSIARPMFCLEKDDSSGDMTVMSLLSKPSRMSSAVDVPVTDNLSGMGGWRNERIHLVC